MGGASRSIARLSAFKRPERHLTYRTLHGGVVTLLGALLMLTLFAHEVAWFVAGRGVARMEVDLQRRHDLTMHVDITFHAVPCASLSFHVLDAAGTLDSDAIAATAAGAAPGAHAAANLHKTRLDARGRPLRRRGLGGGDVEYETPQTAALSVDGGGGPGGGGAMLTLDLGAAMQSLGEMEDELEAHEGCRVRGAVTARYVTGRLQFAVHQNSFMDMLPQMLTGHFLPTGG